MSNTVELTVKVEGQSASYDIVVQRGLLSEIGKHIPLSRRVLVVTDRGVPASYAECIMRACAHPVLACVEMGEGSKSLSVAETLCEKMLREGFTRTDAVVAVGGGVCGDLAGFVASLYMRGIDFYNVPTTLLSQVDSSIGGKTAVNLAGIKNCIGAFYQPKKVLIDPDTLKTLPKRQMANGLAEAIKMAATCDADFFARMENGDPYESIEDVILSSLRIKRAIVEADVQEKSLRRVLNFGHTVGHGIESCLSLSGLFHGECVAIGMLPMCGEKARERLKGLLTRVGLPTACECDTDTVLQALAHDKKADGDSIHYVYVPEIGTYELRSARIADFQQTVKGVLGK